MSSLGDGDVQRPHVTPCQQVLKDADVERIWQEKCLPFLKNHKFDFGDLHLPDGHATFLRSETPISEESLQVLLSQAIGRKKASILKAVGFDDVLKNLAPPADGSEDDSAKAARTKTNLLRAAKRWNLLRDLILIFAIGISHLCLFIVTSFVLIL